MKHKMIGITLNIDSLDEEEYDFLLDKYYKEESIQVLVTDISIDYFGEKIEGKATLKVFED
jgi:hypothetical protein